MGAQITVPMYRRTLPQRLRLEGRRCTACGFIHFPPVATCPACRTRADTLEPLELSGRGTVEAATWITAAGAPPEFADQARETAGYCVAIVRLEEGPAISAQLTGVTELSAIGTPVQAVTRRLYTQEGVVRYGFKFAGIGPTDKEGSRSHE